MIFISHNWKDKPVVEPIALTLVRVFGQQNVFYDSWSIQPGDGIIDKMNQGLSECKFFFFFISRNSLSSDMVRLEWQNALVKAAQKVIRFIPVRIDSSEMPFLLTQALYIDMYSQGLEVATRQIIDVIQGINTYRSPNNKFQNLIAIKHKVENKIIIECRAQFFMEPITDFAFGTPNNIDDLSFRVLNESMHGTTINKNKDFAGNRINIVYLSVFHGTTPELPFIVEFTSKSHSDFDITIVFHKHTHELYEPIPLTIK